MERGDTLIDTKPSEEEKPVQGEYPYSELVQRFYPSSDKTILIWLGRNANLP